MMSWEDDFKKKLIPPQDLERRILELKNQGKKIATINGSFDLLHAGHLEILYFAKKKGDCLIVALNTDDSIRRYKSPKRPFIPLPYRLAMMAAFEFVDYVTWFDETDPCQLLEKIKPHVHINGSEYGENCIEAPVVRKYGGEIAIYEKIPGLSTSEIVKKVQEKV
jgi:D-glycero-beta-D-manno-heptose 1-phosphate adenylyltransferase